MENAKDLRFAVLIDADNIPHRLISEILEEIAKYGVPTFKRIYGDWTKPHVANWKTVLLDHAIFGMGFFPPFCQLHPGSGESFLSGDAHFYQRFIEVQISQGRRE